MTRESSADDTLVSIIIPVYKAECFLDECIESVAQQTHEDLEIILIDDASPDRCPQMCDAWAGKDPRIVVLHVQGGGASAARNAGLDRATGKYVMFVDSDDLLETNAVEYALEVVQPGFGMAIFGKRFIDENGSSIRISAIEQNCFIRYDADNAEDYYATLAHLLKSDYLSPPWSKLFLRDVIGGIRFSTDMTYEEDLDFNLQVLRKHPNVIANDTPLYRYRHLESGLASIFSEQKIASVEQASGHKLEFFRPFLSDKRVQDDVSLHMANSIGWVVPQICESEDISAARKVVLIERLLSNPEIFGLVRGGLRRAWLSRTLKFAMLLNWRWFWNIYVTHHSRGIGANDE